MSLLQSGEDISYLLHQYCMLSNLILILKQQLTTQSHHKVHHFAQKFVSDLSPVLDLSVLAFESTWTSETL